ncbi:MAG TPA: alpha/beta hydrolase [Polyangia bacterium]
MPDQNSSNDILVSWLVDEIEVNATLTRPEGQGPFPAVIMVAGSGPTDRNWNTPLIPGSNGSAALLAQVLAQAGFVTLRYDKRAAGPQGQENAMRLMGKISEQGHLDELAGGVRLLAGRDDVDSRRLFALTNSEGCIHALNYQIQATADPRLSAAPRLAGLLLTSAPARPIGVVAHSQIAAQLAAVPGGEQMLALYDQAIQDFMAGREVNIDPSLPDGLRNLILSVSAPINQPFSRELWMADVAELLPKIDCPVLILLGKKDIQVVWELDSPIFGELIKKQANVQLAYAENANHVLKHEPRPLAELSMADIMASYNADTSRLDERAVEIILGWLKGQG